MKAKILNFASLVLMLAGCYWVALGSFTDEFMLPFSTIIFDESQSFMSWLTPFFSLVFYGILSNAFVSLIMTVIAKILKVQINYHQFGVVFGDLKSTSSV
jgi:hypothetical protein